MAVKNRMGVAVEIAVGSTLQVAMFVAPILVLSFSNVRKPNVSCLYLIAES